MQRCAANVLWIKVRAFYKYIGSSFGYAAFGTAKNAAGQIVMNGGRVLGVTSLAPTLREAADRAYAACEQIQCVAKYYRHDIGARQLNRKS